MQIPISPNASNRRAFNPSRSPKRDIDAVEQVEKVDSRLTGDHTVENESRGWNADAELSSNPSAASNVPASLARRKRMAIENVCTEEDEATAESRSEFRTFSASSSKVHSEYGPAISKTSEQERDYEIQLLLLELQSIKRCQSALKEREQSRRSQTLSPTTEVGNVTPPLPPQSHEHHISSEHQPTPWEQESSNSLGQYHQGEQKSVAGTVPRIPQAQDYQTSTSYDFNQEQFAQARQQNFQLQQARVQADKAYEQRLNSMEQRNNAQLRVLFASRKVGDHNPNLPHSNYPVQVDYSHELKELEQQNKARREAAARRESENPNPNLPPTNHPVKVDDPHDLPRLEQQNKNNYVSYEQEMRALAQKTKARREAARRESENHNPNFQHTNYSVKVDYQRELEELVEQNKRRRMMKQKGIDSQQANPISSTAEPGHETVVDESGDLEAIEAQIQVLQKKADRLRSLKRSHAESVLGN